MRTFLFGLLVILAISSYGQKAKFKHIKSNNPKCVIMLDRVYKEDSSSWNGNCQNGLANGLETMILYTKGNATARYYGNVQDGKPTGIIENIQTFDSRKFWSNYMDKSAEFEPL